MAILMVSCHKNSNHNNNNNSRPQSHS